jgi:hypothetical protein
MPSIFSTTRFTNVVNSEPAFAEIGSPESSQPNAAATQPNGRRFWLHLGMTMASVLLFVAGVAALFYF